MTDVTDTTTPHPATIYYPPPYSLPTLSKPVRTGLLLITTLATFSVFATAVVLALLTHRFLTRPRAAPTSISTNQAVLLVFNLLLADHIQAAAMAISAHWVAVDGIFALTSWCWAQGGLLHAGDLASGGFVVAIAAHTLFSVLGKRVTDKCVGVGCVAVWIGVVCLTVAGPAKFGARFFARAGEWCWISQDYEMERLWLHYAWVFLDEFGTVAIYLSLFIFLACRMKVFSAKSSVTAASSQVTQATRTMLLYPFMYVVLTLPLATLRMIAMSGGQPSDTSYLVAGAMISSCGWIDAIIYTLTRHILSKPDLHRPRAPSAERALRSRQSGDTDNALPAAQFGNRTVITGGIDVGWECSLDDLEICTCPPSRASDGLELTLADGFGYIKKQTTISVFETRVPGSPGRQHSVQTPSSARPSIEVWHPWE